MTLATRISAAQAHVTVTSSTAVITDWSMRYFGPWWNAVDAVAPHAGPVVAADVEAVEVAALAQQIGEGPHQECLYANEPMLYARGKDGVVAAVQPGERLAYRYEPGLLRIVGCDEVPVALAAARLAREVLRSGLLADGWRILHASAAVRDGRTVLALGEKGAGKSTVGFLLARAGWQLLANDRVFVRPKEDGGVTVLPWPSAAAIGLGFLDAIGLYDDVRARVLAGEQLHPTQHESVTRALLDGRRLPIRSSSGKELKPQFFPDQLTTWLGLTLATKGIAAKIVFPRIDPAAAPAVLGEGRTLGEGDFFTGATEDRYPDVFGLAPIGEASRVTRELLATRLADLPRLDVVLGHDVKANAEFLAELATT
ncbi:hypothetical protein L1606_34775 [Streptomyces spororaveus]|uniref:hypothetical protein n=1 Tax=Streptomyces spororaveus TaxID=284039 RepID=UPI002079F477|nr:hypothetical protein [Streptomyces spororaveus]MCM9083185.1 hypothetical protein [Streptomyces spororaveus]